MVEIWSFLQYNIAYSTALVILYNTLNMLQFEWPE